MKKRGILRGNRAFLGRIGAFLGAILDDLLVLGGVVVIVATNFRVNVVLGWYTLGLALIGLGLAWARFSRSVGR